MYYNNTCIKYCSRERKLLKKYAKLSIGADVSKTNNL